MLSYCTSALSLTHSIISSSLNLWMQSGPVEPLFRPKIKEKQTMKKLQGNSNSNKKPCDVTLSLSAWLSKSILQHTWTRLEKKSMNGLVMNQEQRRSLTVKTVNSSTSRRISLQDGLMVTLLPIQLTTSLTRIFQVLSSKVTS